MNKPFELYKVQKYGYSAKISIVLADRESESSFWVKNHRGIFTRVNKISEYNSYFKTKQEAVAHFVSVAQQAIDDNNKVLKARQDSLDSFIKQYS